MAATSHEIRVEARSLGRELVDVHLLRAVVRAVELVQAGEADGSLRTSGSGWSGWAGWTRRASWTLGSGAAGTRAESRVQLDHLARELVVLQGRVGGAPFLGPQRLTRDCGRELYQRIKAATRGLRL